MAPTAEGAAEPTAEGAREWRGLAGGSEVRRLTSRVAGGGDEPARRSASDRKQR